MRTSAGTTPREKLWTTLTFAGIFLVYLATLYPGEGGRVNFGDSIKWQYLWVVGGLPHSPGYPLFMMLCHAFGNLLFFLPVPYRITLISTTSAMIALAGLYKVSGFVFSESLHRRLSLILFAFGSTFWIQATEAEVYSLHAAFIIWTSYFLFIFTERGKRSDLLIASAIYCFGYGNHHLMLMLLPVFIGVAWLRPKVVFRASTVLLLVLIASIGASQYLFLYSVSHKGGEYLEYIGPYASWNRWLAYITSTQFEGGFSFELRHVKKTVLIFLEKVVIDFGPLGVFCIFWFWRSHWNLKKNSARFNLVLSYVSTQFVFCCFYRISDGFLYFIPIFAFFSLFVVQQLFLLPRRRPYFLLAGANFLLLFSVGLAKTKRDKFHDAKKQVKDVMKILPSDANLYFSEGTYGYYMKHLVIYHQRIGVPEKRIRLVHKLSNDLTEFYAFSHPDAAPVGDAALWRKEVVSPSAKVERYTNP